MLSNAGIDARSLVVLDPTSEGTTIRGVNPIEKAGIEAGFSAAEAVLPNAQMIAGRKIQLELEL